MSRKIDRKDIEILDCAIKIYTFGQKLASTNQIKTQLNELHSSLQRNSSEYLAFETELWSNYKNKVSWLSLTNSSEMNKFAVTKFAVTKLLKESIESKLNISVSVHNCTMT